MNGPTTDPEHGYVCWVINSQWAIRQLLEFQALASLESPGPGREYGGTRDSVDQVVRQAQVVEQILDQVIPAWRQIDEGAMPEDGWAVHRLACLRAVTQLERAAELRENLGEVSPQLDASHLHPWVWEGARSRWQSGHLSDAVFAASVQVNAETQKKLGRSDISEADLFKQAFTLDPPEPGKPRLRIGRNDGSKTFSSLHRGVMAFAEGCYAAIRNPFGHTPGHTLSEDAALEQLAAFSVLARWVDEAEVERS
jgi:hypothetical protein